MRDLSFPRWCFAAAHVAVKDEYRTVSHSVESPGTPAELAAFIDWDSTLGIRSALDGYGFGIAEAMDTAQRFSIGWEIARALIEETGRLNLRNGFVAGAGGDSIGTIRSDDELVGSVVRQAETIQAAGGMVIVLPLVHLAESGADASRYVRVYRDIIERVEGPIFLHWLGEAFMPSLRGYFPGESFHEIMAHDTNKVRGVKLSLLDADFEIQVRSRLRGDNQIVLTGDDYNFGDLILGDGTAGSSSTEIGGFRVPTGDFSHALLGVLDGIAAPMARALGCLADGDADAYRDIAGRCEALGRWIFRPPTPYYKSGLACLSYLNGLQSNPMLLNHEEGMRDFEYYSTVVTLAREAGALDRAVDLEALRRALVLSPGAPA